jgi:pimeloyl-ACP methyl ester carboxylesterase
MTAMSKHAIHPQSRTIDGVSIRFAESELRDDHALLLSPWPESLYAFEPIWSRLAEHAHLVAIDLPGFGRSERRNELMSPRAMGEFLVRMADAFGLESPHVVGPDVGPAPRSSLRRYIRGGSAVSSSAPVPRPFRSNLVTP